MDTALVNAETARMKDVAAFYDESRLRLMLAMAREFFRSKCTGPDVANEYQVLAKIQAGFEMGLPPMEALQSLYIVNGHMTIYGAAMTKRLRLNGWTIEVLQEKDDLCDVQVTKDGEKYHYEATTEEVKKLKSSAINFAKKDKLFWHAISRIIRRYIPDVLSAGVQYIKEEVEDIRGFGQKYPDAIDGEEAGVKFKAEDILKEIEDSKTDQDLNIVKSKIDEVHLTFLGDEQDQVKKAYETKKNLLMEEKRARREAREAEQKAKEAAEEPEIVDGVELVKGPKIVFREDDGSEANEYEVKAAESEAKPEPKPKRKKAAAEEKPAEEAAPEVKKEEPEKEEKKSAVSTTADYSEFTPEQMKRLIDQQKTRLELQGLKSELTEAFADGNLTNTMMNTAIGIINIRLKEFSPDQGKQDPLI